MVPSYRFVYHSTQYPLGGYKPWRRGQPDNYKGVQDCARVWLPTDKNTAENASWDDAQCTDRYPFVCECSSK